VRTEPSACSVVRADHSLEEVVQRRLRLARRAALLLAVLLSCLVVVVQPALGSPRALPTGPVVA
jgi:hypothetical protein